ncbi:Protein of unknown function [Gryllus bimaculatus]|nr:Protein of unknown function [Gryllus bimaculatus]
MDWLLRASLAVVEPQHDSTTGDGGPGSPLPRARLSPDDGVKLPTILTRPASGWAPGPRPRRYGQATSGPPEPQGTRLRPRREAAPVVRPPPSSVYPPARRTPDPRAPRSRRPVSGSRDRPDRPAPPDPQAPPPPLSERLSCAPNGETDYTDSGESGCTRRETRCGGIREGLALLRITAPGGCPAARRRCASSGSSDTRSNGADSTSASSTGASSTGASSTGASSTGASTERAGGHTPPEADPPLRGRGGGAVTARGGAAPAHAPPPHPALAFGRRAVARKLAMRPHAIRLRIATEDSMRQLKEEKLQQQQEQQKQQDQVREDAHPVPDRVPATLPTASATPTPVSAAAPASDAVGAPASAPVVAPEVPSSTPAPRSSKEKLIAHAKDIPRDTKDPRASREPSASSSSSKKRLSAEVAEGASALSSSSCSSVTPSPAAVGAAGVARGRKRPPSDSDPESPSSSSSKATAAAAAAPKRRCSEPARAPVQLCSPPQAKAGASKSATTSPAARKEEEEEEGAGADATWERACAACGRPFATPAERATHVRQHRYHCQRCDLAFRSQDWTRRQQTDAASGPPVPLGETEAL